MSHRLFDFIFLLTGTCGTYEYQCPNHGGCIPFHFECDGIDDCGDYSDEQNCFRGSFALTPHKASTFNKIPILNNTFNKLRSMIFNYIISVNLCMRDESWIQSQGSVASYILPPTNTDEDLGCRKMYSHLACTCKHARTHTSTSHILRHM